MQRYFVNEKKNELFTLSNDDSYHIVKVMRMNIGDKVEIVCNNIEYIAEIIELGSNVLCKVVLENEQK